MNLPEIPDQPHPDQLSYWCTWGTQLFHGPKAMPPVGSWHHPVANLSEANLFGPQGWARTAYAEVRGDLYMLFDVGWDIEPTEDVPGPDWHCGRVDPAIGRFPSCDAPTPTERLRKLVALTRSAGWRGAGLWISCHARGEGLDGASLTAEERRAYFRERLIRSHEAGISCWKVDCGILADDGDFRRMISEEAALVAPALRIEHAKPVGPAHSFPGGWDDAATRAAAPRDGRFASEGKGQALPCAASFLPIGHTLRTYDVTPQLSVATTLDRAIELLRAAQGLARAAVLNIEDEPYIGAALQCAIGVMRHPAWNDAEGEHYDPLHARKRSLEVVRAVRWQRLAPPVGAHEGDILTDTQRLMDDHRFVHPMEIWNKMYYLEDGPVRQGAPARMARGLKRLPDVTMPAGRPAPFILASRHPRGLLAVAALPRQINSHEQVPLADVTLWPNDEPFTQIGVFGRYTSLTLGDFRLVPGTRLQAQDLAGGDWVDITSATRATPEGLRIDGAALTRVGSAANPSGDPSQPALRLVVIAQS